MDGDRAEILADAMRSLQMPACGLRTWFHDLRSFCDAHGGERHYAELLELIAACQTAIDPEDDRAV